ncbi:hypothetical protein U1Q18_011779 [Sarracenia purpurea var. burkii]
MVCGLHSEVPGASISMVNERKKQEEINEQSKGVENTYEYEENVENFDDHGPDPHYRHPTPVTSPVKRSTMVSNIPVTGDEISGMRNT